MRTVDKLTAQLAELQAVHDAFTANCECDTLRIGLEIERNKSSQLAAQVEALMAELAGVRGLLSESQEQLQAQIQGLMDQMEDLRARLKAALEALQVSKLEIAALKETQTGLRTALAQAEEDERLALERCAEMQGLKIAAEMKVDGLEYACRDLRDALDKEIAFGLSEKLKAAKKHGAAALIHEALKRWTNIHATRAVNSWRANCEIAELCARFGQDLTQLPPEEGLAERIPKEACVWQYKNASHVYVEVYKELNDELEKAIDSGEQEFGPFPMFKDLTKVDSYYSVVYYPFRRIAVDLLTHETIEMRQMRPFQRSAPAIITGAVALSPRHTSAGN
eukprot:TRINITY_DN43176_c0_g1_i1.p1 TRINITY_DN43176_c0_g1~~TRINITY_DN43176_c0_g1_i1.p1  ORF type:complete len:336 (-),score=104.31 TRINITY_DN43176_c0_g1_i1:103-1110(-)